MTAGTAAAPTTIADGKFVVESIVRSQGSLNEITIHEGQQFIGQESNDAFATAVPQESSSAAGVQQHSSEQLFGGAVIGSLFEDGGDSSDYFCGVRRRCWLLPDLPRFAVLCCSMPVNRKLQRKAQNR